MGTRCPDQIYPGIRYSGTRINQTETQAFKIDIRLTGYPAFRLTEMSGTQLWTPQCY